MYIYESHLGSLYTSDRELSYEETHCEQCGDSDWLVGYAMTGEEAWNLLKWDTDIGGSGGWNYDYIREFILDNYDSDIDNYSVDFDPYYENEIMKFIWGVKSYDDLSGADACLHTMNDIELDYLKNENKYIISIETIFQFEKEEYKLDYLKRCLDSFTKFMVENGYNIEAKPHWWHVFGDGINTHFNSVEECYAMFKMLVNCYCKL
jgi:hypothetical protein